MTSKVVVVTGASRGIGFAVADYLLKASHRVVLVSRSQADLQAIKDKFPSQVEYLAADLTNLDTAPQAVELAVKAFGKLDGIVVNHAALSPMKRIEDSTIEEWKKIYDANLFSALALVKAAIPHLRASRGNIVFTSSGAAFHAFSAWGAYGSSKAAMNSLAQHLAVEEPEIVTIAIGPGRVDTEMQKEIRELGAPGSSMTQTDHADFVSAFEDGKLNKPEWPGYVIAKVVLGAKSSLSGQYIRWNAPELEEYKEN